MKYVFLIVLFTFAFHARRSDSSSNHQVLSVESRTNNEMVTTLQNGKSITKRTPHIIHNSDKISNNPLSTNKHLKAHQKKLPRFCFRYRKVQTPQSDSKLRNAYPLDKGISKISHNKKIRCRKKIVNMNLDENRKISINKIHSYNNSNNNSSNNNNNPMKYNFHVDVENNTLEDIESSQNVLLHTLQGSESSPNSYFSLDSTVSNDIIIADKIEISPNSASYNRPEADNVSYSTATVATANTSTHTKMKMASVLAVVALMLLMPFLVLWLSAVMSAARSQIPAFDDQELLLQNHI